MSAAAGKDPGYDATGNVVALGRARHSSGKRRRFTELRRIAAAMLPRGWFELHDLDREDDGNPDADHGHYMLERVGGPPVGSFELRCDGTHVHARPLPELDQAIDGARPLGRYRLSSEAMAAVVGSIDRQLETWNLPPLAPNRAASAAIAPARSGSATIPTGDGTLATVDLVRQGKAHVEQARLHCRSAADTAKRARATALANLETILDSLALIANLKRQLDHVTRSTGGTGS